MLLFSADDISAVLYGQGYLRIWLSNQNGDRSPIWLKTVAETKLPLSIVHFDIDGDLHISYFIFNIDDQRC